MVTGIPADVCMECGQYVLSPATLQRVQDLVVEDTHPAAAAGLAKLAYRSQRVRVNLRGTLTGPPGLCSDVRVVNLSVEGALIAHAVLLSPGDTFILRVRIARTQFDLWARIRWSRVQDGETVPAGEGALPFYSGLHFPDLPEDARSRMRRALARLRPADGLPGNGAK